MSRARVTGECWVVLVGIALLHGACDAAQAAPRVDSRFGPATARIYVSNEDSGDITVIDPRVDEVVATVPVGKRPRGLRLSRHGRFLYVAVSGSPKAPPDSDQALAPAPDRARDGIAVLDTQSLKVVRVLSGGSDPESFDLSHGEERLWVSNEDSGQVTVLNVNSGKMLRVTPVGAEPEGVTSHPDGASVYVTSEAENAVDVLDAQRGTRLARVPVGARPRSVLFLADGSLAFVATEGSASVDILDARSHARLGTIALDSPRARPMGLALSPDQHQLYVTTGRGKGVSVIDVQQRKPVRFVADVGARPWGIGVSADGRKLYTANGPSDDVTVIDAQSGAILKRIHVGKTPWGIASGPLKTAP